jgi:hypothetical protein
MADETTLTPEPTMLDDLGAAFDAAEKAAEPEADKLDDKPEATETVPTETKSEVEPEPEPAKDKPTEETKPVEAETEPVVEVQPDEGKEGADPTTPPEHWDDRQKQDFEALPTEARPLYLEKTKSLEAGFNRKFEELATERKSLESVKGFKQIFEPLEQQLSMAGTSPEAYTKQLLATAQMLAQDPQGTLQTLARQYGVEMPGKAEAADDLDEFTDPAIRELKAEVAGLKSGQLNHAQQAANSQQQAVENEWTAFVSAKGEGDVDLYPHADSLRIILGTELTANPPSPGETTQDAFKRAYDKHKYSIPEVREREMTAKAKQGDADKEKHRKEALEKAKKAGRNVQSSSAPVGEAKQPAGTIKDELERVWDEAASA